MLASSDTPIEEAVAFFAGFSIDAGYVVPTSTGMTKSIMDAHAQLREWLRTEKIHDYSTQQQGPDHKSVVDVLFIGPRSTSRTTASLYRPVTKTGDPRIWVRGLKEFGVSPGNLLAFLNLGNGDLALINFSDRDVRASAEVPDSPLNSILVETQLGRDQVADELLGKLEQISSMGFLPSLRSGDTGIGYTLESMLGIQANSSRKPDYKGIELKAHRRLPGRTRSNNRVSLFSRVPDWGSSALKSGGEILRAHGYPSASGRRDLYCTVTPRPNPQGLYSRVDESRFACRWTDRLRDDRPVVHWSLRDLQDALLMKHRSTFWVVADSSIIDGVEHFHYRTALHTERPLAGNLAPLLEQGKVTFDFTLSTRETGATRDHGYLFKMWPSDLELLIPRTRSYSLTR